MINTSLVFLCRNYFVQQWRIISNYHWTHSYVQYFNILVFDRSNHNHQSWINVIFFCIANYLSFYFCIHATSMCSHQSQNCILICQSYKIVYHRLHIIRQAAKQIHVHYLIFPLCIFSLKNVGVWIGGKPKWAPILCSKVTSLPSHTVRQLRAIKQKIASSVTQLSALTKQL